MQFRCRPNEIWISVSPFLRSNPFPPPPPLPPTEQRRNMGVREGGERLAEVSTSASAVSRYRTSRCPRWPSPPSPRPEPDPTPRDPPRPERCPPCSAR